MAIVLGTHVHAKLVGWSQWVFCPSLVSCLPGGQQVTLKIAGPCISRCVMNTADCAAYSSAVTITLTVCGTDTWAVTV